MFNSAFDWLATLPPSPISGFLEGALVLVRRSLFFIPTGVSATQTGSSLSIAVKTGSVAYFRQDGTDLQVSNVPIFRRATSFTASTVADVTVANPGNSGSAGLYFTTGSVAADLTTTRIDAITFGDTAQFTGQVIASVGNGTLRLNNAVRGLSGVSLSGPIRLCTDIEVDAGTGDVTFAGTVDATTSGAQALTVTALGTTTFAADVGGQTPLAGLTTRGISPLTITQSDESRTIPLHYLPEYMSATNPDTQLTVKYGIDVAIGDNPSRMYLFDTGAPGFFAGYDSTVWRNVPLGTQPVYTAYGDGTTFDSVVTDAVVTLGTGPHTVSTAQPIQVGAIVAGFGTQAQGYPPLDFTDPHVPPWLSRYYGDFGADLQIMTVNGQPTLASPLFQLPGNLSSGFVAQLGPIGVQPQLTVGVTDALRDQFPYAIPFTAAGPLFPVSGYPSANQFVFTGQYSVSQPGEPTIALGTYDFPGCSQQCLPTLIDSGQQLGAINLPGVIPPYPYADGPVLQAGSIFSATFPTTEGRPALTWSLIAGIDIPVNVVAYSGSPTDPASGQWASPGTTLYNDFDVMFDVANQVIWLRPTDAQANVVLRSVTTAGAQSYAQNAELGGSYLTGGSDFIIGGATSLLRDTLIDTGDGDVTFFGTVDGAVALTVNSGGTATFTREVGSLNPLRSVTTDRAGNTVTNQGWTLGEQDYRDDLSVNGNYYSGGNFSVGGSTTLAGPVNLTATGTVSFAGTVDSLSDKGFTLALTASGPMTFGSSVGADNPLGGLSLTSGAVGVQAVTATAANPVNLNGALGYSTNSTGDAIGLEITGVTAAFTGGGVIQQFAGGGVFIGDSASSQLSGFTIVGNGTADTLGGVTAVSVADLQVTDCAITANYGPGVTVAGPTSLGNAVVSNSIYDNTGAAILLLDGANGGQAAPQDLTAQQFDPQTAVVSGTVAPAGGYTGEFLVQVFGNLGGTVPGQFLIGETVTTGGVFTVNVPLGTGLPDFDFTSFAATATPVSGPSNTSPFSIPVPLL
ncbi:MAG: right-handed parallel beta-helix repeat-containing protein [Mycobacterium sp.]|nr:right-handed parallel beta-helix repeat-containing protein [Mycobacterium sp.]